MRRNLLEFLRPPGPRLVYKANDNDELVDEIFGQAFEDDSLWIKVSFFAHDVGSVYYDISNSADFPALFDNMSRIVLCEIIDSTYISAEILYRIVLANYIDIIVKGLINFSVEDDEQYAKIILNTTNHDLSKYINPQLDQVMASADSILTPLPDIEDCPSWSEILKSEPIDLKPVIDETFCQLFPKGYLIPDFKRLSLIEENSELRDAIRRIVSIEI